MNNPTLTIKHYWRRLKAFASRLFAMVQFLCVGAFFALMFVVGNYVELRSIVLSILDEQTVALVKDAAKLIYGTPSVLLALEQTAILVALPSIGVLLRSICTVSFVLYLFYLLCCVVKNFLSNTVFVCHAQPQRETCTQHSNKWLTLCKFIS